MSKPVDCCGRLVRVDDRVRSTPEHGEDVLVGTVVETVDCLVVVRVENVEVGHPGVRAAGNLLRSAAFLWEVTR